MKTQDEIKAEALRRITEQVRDKYETVDSDALYCDFLDELYEEKLNAVGPEFRGLKASALIKENAPTDYRCGFSDWIDGEDIREFDSNEFRGSDLDEAKEAVEDALDSEIIYKEEAIEEIEGETVTVENEEENSERLAELRDELDELNAILAAVKAYTF